MNTVYQVSRADYQILISVYKLLKGSKSVVSRKTIVADSGLPKNTLSNRVNNVYIKEKIFEENNNE